MTATLALPRRTMALARFAGWWAVAWRRLGWRHVVLAAALSVLWTAVGPVGGAWLFPLERKEDLIASFLSCRFLRREFVLVWFTLVADAAFDDGVPAWLAYGAALLAAVVVSPEIDRQVGHWQFGWNGSRAYGRFWQMQLLTQGSVGLAMYAYWRSGQKALERLHEIDTERLRLRQRIEAATLRALQARVDPQLLSDALARVEQLHALDAPRADALLGDLIALLRAMLPQDDSGQSTVGEEMALVEAWLLVRRQVDDELPALRLQAPPELASETLAPMLLLPLLRDVLAAFDPGPAWTLAASVDGSRLRIALASEGPPPPRWPELGDLRERLQTLHAEEARLLSEGDSARAWTLEVPRGHDTKAIA